MAGGQQVATALNILPRTAHVGAATHGAPDFHHILEGAASHRSRIARVLHGHNRICPMRQPCAGRDARRLALADGNKPARPRLDLAHHTQPDGIALRGIPNILRTDGKSVHGGVVKGRQVKTRHDLLRQHTACGVIQLNPLTWER
jgi:hypothetical protein